MINFDDFEIFRENLSTLRKLSMDDSDALGIQYMTDSEMEAVDFDAVKTEYMNQLGLSEENAASIDAIVDHMGNRNIIFIEFKNGNMKNEKRKVKDKIRDSLLIFNDITGKNITYSRQWIDFILVYNLEKNPVPNQLTKRSVQDSASRYEIAKYFLGKGNKELIRFDLERFEKLYFRSVHTYSKKEFEIFLQKQCG